MLTAILSALVASPIALPILAGALASLVAYVFRKLFKERADKAESDFVWALGVAYNVVNEVARVTPTKIDDKLALGLGFLKEALSHKGQTLNLADEERAKLLFKAMHGREAKNLDPHDVLGVK